VAVAKVSDCSVSPFTIELHQRMCWMGMGWHGPNTMWCFCKDTSNGRMPTQIQAVVLSCPAAWVGWMLWRVVLAGDQPGYILDDLVGGEWRS
jgi:hypothetical protein